MNDTAPYAAPALEKGLDILELLAEAGEPLTLSAIAERLDRSRSEIFRMAHVLHRRGYLVRERGTERLLLSRQLFDLGIRAPGTRALVPVMLPLMERVSDETGQGTQLSVLSRGESVVVASTQGHMDAFVAVRPGYGRPPLDSNSGLLLLAFQPPERRPALLGEAGASLVARLESPATRALFAELLRAGHHIAPSRDVVAVTDIACPVLGPAGTAVAALLVPALQRYAVPTDSARILAALTARCAEAGRRLGYG